VKPARWATLPLFSFYPTKNLSAAGDAGMVATQSDELAERAKMPAPARHAPPLPPRRDRLEHAHGRISGRHSLGQAALHRRLEPCSPCGGAALPCAISRRGNAEAGPYPVHGVVLPHEVAGSRHVWHQYVIRTSRRDALRAFLAERKIGSEIYYPVPLHMQDALKSLVTPRAASRRPSAPLAKCSPCPSSPRFAKTSSKRSSMPSPSF